MSPAEDCYDAVRQSDEPCGTAGQFCDACELKWVRICAQPQQAAADPDGANSDPGYAAEFDKDGYMSPASDCELYVFRRGNVDDEPCGTFGEFLRSCACAQNGADARGGGYHECPPCPPLLVSLSACAAMSSEG